MNKYRKGYLTLKNWKLDPWIIWRTINWLTRTCGDWRGTWPNPRTQLKNQTKAQNPHIIRPIINDFPFSNWVRNRAHQSISATSWAVLRWLQISIKTKQNISGSIRQTKQQMFEKLPLLPPRLFAAFSLMVSLTFEQKRTAFSKCLSQQSRV